MIGINVRAVVGMCSEFMGHLAGHATSAVVNVASPAAMFPVPYMAVYGASKAFVSSFSQALYGEWMELGILVQTLYPGPMATELEGSDALGGDTQAAEAVVRRSLAGLAVGAPRVAASRGLRGYAMLGALLPARLLIEAVGKRFRPRTALPRPGPLSAGRRLGETPTMLE